MKRIRFGASLPALLFIAPLGGGFVLLHGCVPDADTSGLPPYDAGLPAEDVTTIVPEAGGEDGGPDTGTDAADTGAAETSNGTATIVGVVLDYTQGAGKGVVPGATLSVLNGPTVTAGLDGTFVIPNVTAGRVQINVAHPLTSPFQGTSQTVYSTTQVVVNVTGGQTLTIEPVLHEGCVGLVQMGSANTTDGGVPTTLLTANCGGRNITSDYVAVTFQDVNALVNASDTSAYPSGGETGLARVEMIPLAYPQNAAKTVTDFSWGAGMPGQATQIDTVGAAEVRVVDDASGNPLAIAAGKTVTLTVPISPAATALTLQQGNYAPWFYDAVGGQWQLDTAAQTALGKTPATINGTNTITITAPHLTWWAVTSPIAIAPVGGTATTGCFTGTITLPNGSPAGGVWVHAIGTDWLGASTAITSASGAFCVDVKKTSHALIQAAAVQGAGSAAALAYTTTTAQTSGTASCESNQGQACTNLGALPMASVSPSCVAGTVDQGSSPPSSFALTLTNVLTNAALAPAQESAGMLNTAYIGPLSTDDGGAFCAPVVAGASFSLVNPSVQLCSSPSWTSNGPGSLTVPAAQAAAACGSAGCFDAGDIFYGCY